MPTVAQTFYRGCPCKVVGASESPAYKMKSLAGFKHVCHVLTCLLKMLV